MREKFIEAYLVKRVKELGGEIRKVEWVSRRGAPDRLVMLSGKTPFWVELKATGEKPEPHQLREHNRLKEYGCVVHVIDSFEGVDEVVK